MVLREIARLRAELDSRYDIYAIGYCAHPGALGEIKCVPVLEYMADDLLGLPYPAKTARFHPPDYIGNADLAPMKFFLDHPDYDYYWIIEYDVRFSGKWPELFADLSRSRADLLCTTLQTWSEHPDWHHWTTLNSGARDVPMERRIKGFMPFCRLSHAMLEACDLRYREGWSGHSEVLWGTVAAVARLPIEDVGGSGSFTPARRRGCYYSNTPGDWSQSPGTFVYRPPFAEHNLFGPNGNSAGTLWHPVKE